MARTNEVVAAALKFSKIAPSKIKAYALETLIDKLGDSKVEVAIAKDHEKSYKNEVIRRVKKRGNSKVYYGKKFQVTYNRMERFTFNREECKEELQKFFQEKTKRKLTKEELDKLVDSFYVPTYFDRLDVSIRAAKKD